MQNEEELIDTFREHGTSVYRYVYVRTGYHIQIAEDITQDVFEKAWKNRASFDSNRASMKTWLFTIARNTVTDYFRKRKLKKVPIEEHEPSYVDDSADKELLVAEVEEKLKELSDSDRELLVLRYIEEFDIEEIAKVTNKSYNTTKVAIHRAMKRLTKTINEEDRKKHN